MLRNSPRHAPFALIGNCKTTGDGKEIYYDVMIDWKLTGRGARKAAKNKSRTSNLGPLRIIVTKVEQLSNNRQTGGNGNE